MPSRAPRVLFYWLLYIFIKTDWHASAALPPPGSESMNLGITHSKSILLSPPQEHTGRHSRGVGKGTEARNRKTIWCWLSCSVEPASSSWPAARERRIHCQTGCHGFAVCWDLHVSVIWMCWGSGIHKLISPGLNWRLEHICLENVNASSLPLFTWGFTFITTHSQSTFPEPTAEDKAEGGWGWGEWLRRLFAIQLKRWKVQELPWWSSG